MAAPDVPQLGAVVQIERSDRAGRLGGLHPFDDHLAGGFRQRGKDAAAVEPAHAAGEDRLPVEIARLELRGGFIRAVVEHHRGAHALAAVAVDGGHVGTVDAVVLESLVKWLDAHGPHALGDQVADRVIHHGRGDAGLQAEAIRQIGGAVELAAADVDLALGRLAEGNDARIEAMDQRAQGEKIQCAFWFDIQSVFHWVLLFQMIEIDHRIVSRIVMPS